MKPEDLIMASFIEAEASTTNILQPDIEDLVDNSKVEEALSAVDKYYGMAKAYLNDPTPDYEGRNPMESWSYEKNRYNNYTDFNVQATALATKMSDYGNDVGPSLKNGMYDPQEFISWYEDKRDGNASAGAPQEKY